MDIISLSNTEDSFIARLEVEPDENRVHPEHCKANKDQILLIGRKPEEQVRIEIPTVNGNIGAIYTLSRFFLNDEGRLILGNRIKDLHNCKPSANSCDAVVKGKIMLKGLDDPSEAETLGELIEQASPNIQNSKLIVIAPHGGEIEPWTDVEAEFVTKSFSSVGAALWMCKGFSSQGNEDAFERWHITSTEINTESFPKLKTLMEQNLKFDYSVAFHGWKEDFICVGGNPENQDTSLISDIRDAIDDTLEERDPDIVVNIAPCSGDFNGDAPENIVNRLGINSVQIEQCKKARRLHHQAIAEAVVKVLWTRINAGIHSTKI